MKNAKSLITGEMPLNEAPEGMPPVRPQRPPGGMPPRRPGMRPGSSVGAVTGDQGEDGQDGGMLNSRERVAFKDLVLLDLLFATGNDPLYSALVDAAINGTDPDPGSIQHFLDEAGKYANKMSPEVNALMGKLASMPR